MRCRFSFCLAALFVFAVSAFAQQDQPTRVKRTTAPATSAASGEEMFINYCASCHGKSGKGDGPAAAALKLAPANLTELGKKNGGKYPAMRVTTVLNGQANLAAHGNTEMPVWGAVFRKMSGGREAEVQQRIANLNHYVESLQVK
jgi:mono/diheme cytochrome c family protein